MHGAMNVKFSLNHTCMTVRLIVFPYRTDVGLVKLHIKKNGNCNHTNRFRWWYNLEFQLKRNSQYNIKSHILNIKHP